MNFLYELKKNNWEKAKVYLSKDQKKVLDIYKEFSKFDKKGNPNWNNFDSVVIYKTNFYRDRTLLFFKIYKNKRVVCKRMGLNKKMQIILFVSSLDLEKYKNIIFEKKIKRLLLKPIIQKKYFEDSLKIARTFKFDKHNRKIKVKKKDKNNFKKVNQRRKGNVWKNKR